MTRPPHPSRFKKFAAIVRDRRGFSLIEIIIVVTLAVSIVLVVGNLNSNIGVLNGLVNQELQSRSTVDQTLQIMENTLRAAVPSASGAYPIVAAATSSVTFFSNDVTSSIADEIRYFFASSTLWSTVIAPTGTPATYPTSTGITTDLIDGVIVATSTPLFSYYNSSYTGTQPAMTSTADVSPIRLIGISFSAINAADSSSKPESFSVIVEFRNLKSN